MPSGSRPGPVPEGIGPSSPFHTAWAILLELAALRRLTEQARAHYDVSDGLKFTKLVPSWKHLTKYGKRRKLNRYSMVRV